jgi:NADH-quinone oxidoreductase subunit J
MNYLFFYLFSSLSVIFSLLVVISRNPIHSILSLIVVFFNIASFFILLGAEFLAMLFVIVYVGAVAVLFLFVIMMLDIKLVSLNVSVYRYTPIFLIFGFVFLSEFILAFCNDLTFADTECLFSSHFLNYCFGNLSNNWYLFVFSFINIITFSNYIYTIYFLLFILSGIILLVSMIGAISLTLHRRNDVKRQYIYKQIIKSFSNSIVWKS